MTKRAPGAAMAGDLLDVNVWLALAIEEHPHHEAAASYWASDDAAARFFCRLSAMSLVRLLANKTLMAGRPLTLSKAWGLYRRFAALPGVGMMEEPHDLDTDLDALVTAKLPSRLFSDAYFAALAVTARLRLVTFDQDFDRFDRLALLQLSPTRTA